MSYGLPVEGDDGPFVGEEVAELPTCRYDQTVADARALLDGADHVVVLAGEDLAVGLVDADVVEGAADDDRVLDVMVVIPGSIRPSVTVASLAERDIGPILVTTSDGRLMGLVEG